jgi:hypothetical protein
MECENFPQLHRQFLFFSKIEQRISYLVRSGVWAMSPTKRRQRDQRRRPTAARRARPRSHAHVVAGDTWPADVIGIVRVSRLDTSPQVLRSAVFPSGRPTRRPCTAGCVDGGASVAHLHALLLRVYVFLEDHLSSAVPGKIYYVTLRRTLHLSSNALQALMSSVETT